MIHTEAQYQRSVKIVQGTNKKLEEQKGELRAKGLRPDAIKRVLDPTRAFLRGIQDDVEWYENAKKGKIPLHEDLESIGRILVALRISKGMTQEDLARKLNITQGQVSQDEEDEYHGISVERANRILAVFGMAGKMQIVPAQRRKAA